MKKVLMCLLICAITLSYANLLSCISVDSDLDIAYKKITVVMNEYEHRLTEKGVVISPSDIYPEEWYGNDDYYIAYRMSFEIGDIRVLSSMSYDDLTKQYDFSLSFLKNYIDELDDAYIDFDSLEVVFFVCDMLFEPECSTAEFIKRSYNSEYLIQDFHTNKNMLTEKSFKASYGVNIFDNSALCMDAQYYLHHHLNSYTPDGYKDYYTIQAVLTVSGTKLLTLSDELLQDSSKYA